MPLVSIPAMMRSLTGGEAQVEVPGETVGEVIDNLEARFPGLKERLVDGRRIRSSLALFVDNEMPATGLRARLRPDSQIYFAPAVAGGASRAR